ncbi:hypothetical protein NP493_662g01088 [Ridgeia piscesae]|uniref:Uncharacterized protein n=1 Tax=Ridgeia piscesae TaxID=27915 RepID=A0AAD9KS46_RIDPI|nr:hypothetical protein NP493_662g01088 [Ridgeia piscesae]
MKLVFPGCILSSASTQMAFVSFTDWYNMSCPSTLRLAIVNTSLFLSFCDTVPPLCWTSLISYWTSFWAGMSFHVARNIRLSISPSSINSTWIGTTQEK